MKSDIELEDDDVILRGAKIIVDGDKVILRRTKRATRGRPATNTDRRAITQSKDTLTINEGADFRATRIEGPITVAESKRTSQGAEIQVVDKSGRSLAVIDRNGIRTRGDINLPIKRFLVTRKTSSVDQRIPNIDRLDRHGGDSLLRTLRWYHDRIRELEKKLRLKPTDFPDADQRRG